MAGGPCSPCGACSRGIPRRRRSPSWRTSFTSGKVAAELAYLDRPTSAGFERPYGWGWLLYLHLEASRHEDRLWAVELEPLARAFAERLHIYLAKLTYPIRVGTHFNTAFALILALAWAEGSTGRWPRGLAFGPTKSS